MLSIFGHPLLLYAILTPIIFAGLILAGTYAFTNLRYYVTLYLNEQSQSKIVSPVKLPYYIPVIGSAFDFLSSKPGWFWSYLFKWHPRATGACTLKMGGRTMHILYDPHAIQALMKAREPHRDSFNMDALTKVFGCSTPQAVKYYGQNEPASEQFGGRTPTAELERIWVDYILKTDRVNELTAKYTEVLREQLGSELSVLGESKEIKLYSWVRNRIFKASITAFYGTTCLEEYPELENDFYIFDSNFLTCYFDVPRWLTPEPYEYRDKLSDRLARWKEKTYEQTKGQIIDPEGDVAWDPVQGSRTQRAREVYYEKKGLDLRTRVGADLGFIFGLQSNAIPVAGWILMHILDPNGDKTLLPRVMDEINASKRANGSFDIATLVIQPLLLSILHEILRLYCDVLVTKELPNDLTLPIGDGSGKKLLFRKGSIIVAPTWVMHRDVDLWEGPSAETFYADRFLTTDPKTEKQVFSTAGTTGKLIPFGGGKTICPGRVFAKQEILGGVAMILSEFEIESLGYVDVKGNDSKTFPRMKDSYPGTVAMTPYGDIKLRIKRRR